MGKIDDNGTMRDPSSEESTQIGQKIKGGISPEYELIKTIDVSQLSEPVSMITITEDEDGNPLHYDDLYIKALNVTSSNANDKFAVQWFIDNVVSSMFRSGGNNDLSGTTAKSIYMEITRDISSTYKYFVGGSLNQWGIQRVNTNNAVPYSDKLNKLQIYTSGTFATGKFEIYGKVRF